MPYLVLAFGLTMSVIGVVSILFGYPIIQVERGWASVIAGATLLAGGAVTAALGLVLKAVKDIGLVAPLRDIAPLPISQHTATPVVDFGGLELPIAKKKTGPSVADLPTTSLGPSLVPEISPQETPSPEATVQADKADEAPPLGFDEPIEPAPAPISTPEPEPVPVHVPETLVPPTLPLPEPAPPSPKAGPEPAVLTDDWLEQSFAEFDRENAGLIATAPAEPELVPSISEPSAAPEPDHAIPVAEPAPAATPATPDHSSAVIGRYEADGTSYVMYADGSIEASSPAGVYRFASMAELKAYIEG